MTCNGESFLSLNQKLLFQLQKRILLKYETLVHYTVQGPDVPRKLDEYINWFIPVSPPLYDLIADYIQNEFKSKIRRGELIMLGNEEFYQWGVHVSVYPIRDIPV